MWNIFKIQENIHQYFSNGLLFREAKKLKKKTRLTLIVVMKLSNIYTNIM